MRELGRRERLSQESDKISQSPSRSVEEMPRGGETEIVGMDPSSSNNQRPHIGNFQEALDPTVEPTESSNVGANVFQWEENVLQEEQADARTIETTSFVDLPVDALPDRRELISHTQVRKIDAQNIEAGEERERKMGMGDSAKAGGFTAPRDIVDGQNQKQEDEKAEAESLVLQESSVDGLGPLPKLATEKMQASAMLIQNALRCRKARVVFTSTRQRHERLVEQQAMMQVNHCF